MLRERLRHERSGAGAGRPPRKATTSALSTLRYLGIVSVRFSAQGSVAQWFAGPSARVTPRVTPPHTHPTTFAIGLELQIGSVNDQRQIRLFFKEEISSNFLQILRPFLRSTRTRPCLTKHNSLLFSILVVGTVLKAACDCGAAVGLAKCLCRFAVSASSPSSSFPPPTSPVL
jgi:hypothetical protein